MKRSVSVDIAGQKLTLKTDADDAYVQALARAVTERINELRGARSVSMYNVALLAALSLADDLFQARRDKAALADTVRQKSRRLLQLLEQAGESI